MNAVRRLTSADNPAAMRLKDAVGWNQTALDWKNVLALAPEGCFGIDDGGRLVATTTAVCFGKELAWVGMVITDPDYRGRGLAKRLMEHALDYLRARGVHWIKLDATDMGRPLYQQLGFRDEGAIERWLRPAGRLASGDHRAGKYEADLALDRQAFGADRSALLNVLAGIESASITGLGYAMGRPGSNAAFFGPSVAQSIDAARELARWFVGRHPQENIFWDVLPANAQAVELARELGFAPARKLVRMSLADGNAPPLANRDELVFAAAGFEYG